MNTHFDVGQSWAVLSPVEQSIKQKIEKAGKPLKEWGVSINYGIKTGLNEAFIISGAKKDELVSADPKSAEIIRPILRGRDIKRYAYNFSNTWLINSHNGIKEKNIPPVDIRRYPAIKKYLDNFYEKLVHRQDQGITPYNLRNCAYMNDFFKHKIIWAELARTGNAFTYDESQKLILNTSYILVTDDENISLKHLLGLLNSKLILFYTNIISSKFDENGWRWLKQFVEKLPILHTRNLNIEKYVDNIIKLKKEKKDSSIFEKKLNYYIYDLYDLDDSEKLFIENNVH